MNYSLKVENLTKIFRIYHDKRLKGALISIIKRRPIYDSFVVLKDINFEVKKGECLGIIGANGSGKSTLLKLIAGILSPDEVSIYINGKISTLIELYSGQHDDLTGLENIFLVASAFGLTRKQIKERLEKIIQFSGLGNFIDTQTRFYSDGMRARLGFSVAAHVDSDILLIDEVLAVGDLEFKERCYNKIYNLKENGVSIIYVSHDFDSIRGICNRVLWLEKGVIRCIGEPEDVISNYTKAHFYK